VEFQVIYNRKKIPYTDSLKLNRVKDKKKKKKKPQSPKTNNTKTGGRNVDE
jgi:hypothetical protein